MKKQGSAAEVNAYSIPRVLNIRSLELLTILVLTILKERI